ncbi:hypothetical protein GOP47_0001600 [Adiantum capillus-veneris]|uniref:Uncharacterized protein n=1 Tax=Adiantum capillus-veneris TaxID=13818 RepID=A0A9D4V957_ADICA|nr:hypothetical protein GOP47_0001600 [Adiantum capillus-veneris]
MAYADSSTRRSQLRALASKTNKAWKYTRSTITYVWVSRLRLCRQAPLSQAALNNVLDFSCDLPR